MDQTSSLTPGPCKAEGKNVVYRASFAWVNDLIRVAYQRPLKPAEIDELPPNMFAKRHFEDLKAAWDFYLKQHCEQDRSRPLFRALVSAYWTRYHFNMVMLKGAIVLLVFARPWFLQLLLRSLNTRTSSNLYIPYLYAVGLAFVSMSQALLVHWYYWQGVQCALTVRGGLVGLIHNKVLNMHASVMARFPAGVILNMANSDADAIMSFCWNSSQEMWSSPLIIVVSLVWLYALLGPSALFGTLLMTLSVALSAGFLSKLKAGVQKRVVELSDQRIHHINELIANIKLIKLYNWEKYFSKRILGIRWQQSQLLDRMALLANGTRFIGTVAPMLVTLLTFGVYAGVYGQPLGASTIFTSLMLFNNMKEPLSKLPEATNLFIRTLLAASRIEKFLMEPNQASISQEGASSDELIFKMDRVSTGWSPNSPPIIRDISCKIPAGSLVFIVGPVGCGKTTLMETLLQETFLLSGEFYASSDDIAYCTQMPYIQADTIRNNILFGKRFNTRAYLNTIKACALVRDFEMLKDGDASLVGDQDGVQLSGGQRQRLALARAVYQDRDTYILDEPLSAVDAHVAKWLFDNVIGKTGILRKRTRVIVTHRIQFATEADLILMMDQGKIVASGTYKELTRRGIDLATHAKPMQKPDETPGALSDLSDLREATDRIGELIQKTSSSLESLADVQSDDRRSILASLSSLNEDSHEVVPQNPEKITNATNNKENDLILASGATKAAVYYKYFLSSRPFTFWAIAGLMIFLSQSMVVASELYLAKWTSGELASNPLNQTI